MITRREFKRKPVAIKRAYLNIYKTSTKFFLSEKGVLKLKSLFNFTGFYAGKDSSSSLQPTTSSYQLRYIPFIEEI